MFKRILVQLDPARRVHQAPRLALHLAERFKAELAALYVIDEKVSHIMGGDLVHTIDAALSAVGREALEDYGVKVGRRVKYTKAMGYGDTSETLSRYAIRQNCDLVVTGGFHASIYQRIPFGSQVNDLIRQAPTTVFLYRDAHGDPMRPGPVVVPIDGSLPALRAMHAAAQVVGPGQFLDVVHVRRRKTRAKAEQLFADVQAAAEKLPCKVETHTIGRSAFRRTATAILRYARSVDAPFIALSRAGARTDRMGVSPVVEHMVVHTDRPLLVIQS